MYAVHDLMIVQCSRQNEEMSVVVGYSLLCRRANKQSKFLKHSVANMAKTKEAADDDWIENTFAHHL